MKPRYIAVQCSWCKGDHWLVKPNILTSRSLRSTGVYATQAEAEAEAARQSTEYRFRQHRARDPHCTCPDCSDAHFTLPR